ncbi:MAG: GNAT family N-acetyltransferase [Sporichthyaceae bacterium]
MGEHLTHGWEPDTPAEDSLLRQFVLANAAHSRFLAEAVGGRTAVWDDLSAADPASPIFFDNAAHLLTPPQYTDLDGAMARLLAFYPPERHWVLLSAWPTPDLTAYGLELMGHPPFMVRPAGGAAPPLPTGLRIERVRDAAGLADFVSIVVAGFGMNSHGLPLADPVVLDGPVQMFVGYLDDRPVATAGARVGFGVTDVDWVANLPEVRGRGIGAALTWAATLAEPANPAVLIASDDGQPVYARMGYLRLLRTTMWHRPPR